jgi:hypothetical protein
MIGIGVSGCLRSCDEFFGSPIEGSLLRGSVDVQRSLGYRWKLVAMEKTNGNSGIVTPTFANDAKVGAQSDLLPGRNCRMTPGYIAAGTGMQRLTLTYQS